jgi:hypothetical protein
LERNLANSHFGRHDRLEAFQAVIVALQTSLPDLDLEALPLISLKISALETWRVTNPVEMGLTRGGMYARIVSICMLSSTLPLGASTGGAVAATALGITAGSISRPPTRYQEVGTQSAINQYTIVYGREKTYV